MTSCKEYLEKQPDGTYSLVLRGDLCKDDDIEVPEGMNYAYDAGSFIQFTKQEMGYRDSVLVWQRELRAMVNPMKEYLNANCNYEFVLSNKKYDGFIEIPEGAIRARFYPNDPDELEFEGDFCQWWHDKDNEWINYENYSNTLEHSRVVWQRDQDEPFLTPECALNENCSGTVKSYIDNFHVSSIDTNPFKEIHGTVKAEPDLNDQYAEIEQVRQATKDNVNHPSHYADSAIECIDAMEAMMTTEQFIGYLRGNLFKYQWRYEKKNGIEDLKKAKWYLEKLTVKVAEKNAPF